MKIFLINIPAQRFCGSPNGTDVAFAKKKPFAAMPARERLRVC